MLREFTRYCTHVHLVYKNTHTKKKILAVSMSFLIQKNMNDNIIMSKQLFTIPERKACRSHDVQLFTD